MIFIGLYRTSMDFAGLHQTSRNSFIRILPEFIGFRSTLPNHIGFYRILSNLKKFNFLYTGIQEWLSSRFRVLKCKLINFYDWIS